MHGVGNDPTYNAKSCFETYPFPQGLTPADTAHQQTEAIAGGALIPAHLGDKPIQTKVSTSLARTNAGSTLLRGISVRASAIAIATAAKHLNDLRDNWLNPNEWTHKVKEITPLGMDHTPYPDRIEAKPGVSEDDLKALQKRTLTNLYNLSPAWLAMAHAQLDEAVAAAYGWADCTVDMPDEEILKRLLALNMERSKGELERDTTK